VENSAERVAPQPDLEAILSLTVEPASEYPDPWRAHDPKITGIVKLDERRLGMRITLASGERMTMPLGQTTFHMRLDQMRAQPRKA
jgi:hypothetical protein